MFCDLSFIFKIGNIWGRNVLEAKRPGTNRSGRTMTKAKLPGDEMSPLRKTGGEALETKHRGRNIRIPFDMW